jgi:hypothetical protein
MRRSSVILVEGLPGSGKTSVAQRLCTGLRRRGFATAWVREEAKDHRVLPVALRRRRRAPDFAQQCLDAWARFMAADDGRVWIFDGAALQSTVRFLFEERVPEPRIAEYWNRFEEIMRPSAPVLVYLRHDDSAARLRDVTIPERGREWYDAVARHVAGAPAGRRHRHRDLEGFVAFWMEYEALCDRLVASATLRVQTMREVLLPQ